MSASVVWEIRAATGNDSNGGGFDSSVGSPGTDYSQQDSAQVAYSDLVIGATNTQLTSAAHPFTSAHVGNVIQITGGSGFTTGFYVINSVSSSVATMNAAVGIASSTGGTGNLGGALATLGSIFGTSSGTTYVSPGNTVWLKGTFTLTTTVNLTKNTAAALYQRVAIIGYGTSRGDNSQATITTATNSVVLLTINIQGLELRNINFTTTAGTKAPAIKGNSSVGTQVGEQVTIRDCTITGFTIGIDGYNGGYIAPLFIHNSSITGCSSHGIQVGSFTYIEGCYVNGNSGDGINGQQYCTIICLNTVSASNTGIGFNFQSTNNSQGFFLKQCVAYNNTSDGIRIGQSANNQPLVLVNSIIYSNSGYGINGSGVETAANPFTMLLQLNNAFGSNTSGARNTGMPTDTTDISLSANPFNNAAGGDFSLNTTAGGGAACLNAGWQPTTL